MIVIRKAEDRGHFDHGWLDTYHTFSFDQYYDPNQMGFRSLRVINEDRVEPEKGFPTHSHRDMEIITYVLDGALEHSDSMGNGSIIRPGDVQRMTAGSGVAHSERNHSKTESVHFLQIWILPGKTGFQPAYEQKFFTNEEKQGKLRLIASQDGREGSVKVHQSVQVYSTILNDKQQVVHRLDPERHAWIQIARGDAIVEGESLKHGDGASISGASMVRIVGLGSSEVLLFDLQ